MSEEIEEFLFCVDEETETDIDIDYEDESEPNECQYEEEYQDEQDCNSDPDDTIIEKEPSLFCSKNKHLKWSDQFFLNTFRTKTCNILKFKKGLTMSSKFLLTPSECFLKFFSFIPHVVDCTNKHIDDLHYSRDREAKGTDESEVKALFGLLFMAGLLRARFTNVKQNWESDGTGIELFKLSMSYQRFLFLMRALRFDVAETRDKHDPIAPIRELFDELNINLQANYTCGASVCIDERLEKFHGRCKFKMCIPSKPAKYGIKLFSGVDCETFYTSKMELYSGFINKGDHQMYKNFNCSQRCQKINKSSDK